MKFTPKNFSLLIHFWYWWDDELTDHQQIPWHWFNCLLPRYITMVTCGDIWLDTVQGLCDEANRAWMEEIDAVGRIEFMNHYHLVLQRDVEWDMRNRRRKEAAKLNRAA